MKTALITGYAVNIGKSIAETFIEKGYHVIGTYCKNTRSENDAMRKKYPDIEAYEVDFTNEVSTTNLIDALQRVSFDVIVNNAGILDLLPDRSIRNEFLDFDYHKFRDVFRCNFEAPLRLCIELKDRMVPGGSIVNICSGGGMRASYATLSYAASKAALINLTISLSNSFYPYRQIRVNAVSPGWVNPETEGGMCSDADSPGGKAALLTSLGRNATTKEIANVVYYLTTPEASFINGANIVVDGGWLNHNVIYYEEATGKMLLR